MAGAAAVGIPMIKIVELFATEATRVFRRRRFGYLHIQSKYSRHALEKMVRSCVSDVTLAEVSTPLMITSSDIYTGGVHVFKSRYLKDLGEAYVRDADVPRGRCHPRVVCGPLPTLIRKPLEISFLRMAVCGRTIHR